MNVFIVKIGEPLLGEGLRPRRMTVFAKALVAAGHQVTWWTSDWNHQRKARRAPEVIQAAASEGIQIHMLSAPGYFSNVSPRRLIHHLVFAWRLLRALNKAGRPDLVWVCFPTVPVAVAVSAWARSRNIRVVYDVRDLSPDVIIESSPGRLRQLLRAAAAPVYRAIGRAFSNAAGLTGVSPAYLQWAQELAARHGGNAPLSQVLPLGYELEDYPASRREVILRDFSAAGLDLEGPMKLVYAGAFGRSYDLETVLDAATLCMQRQVPVQIILAGGGDQLAGVQRRLPGLDNTVYLGWLNAEQLRTLLSVCQVGLMPYTPSATQGLPNKLFEYVGNGLCLLNSLQGEAREFIAQHAIGFTYTPADAEDLAAAIARLALDPAQVKLCSQASLQLFEQGLDSAALSRQMTAFAVRVQAAQA